MATAKWGYSHGSCGGFGEVLDLVTGRFSKGFRAIGCRFVFRKEDGEQGLAQKEGVDYIELFYRVVMHTSTRLLLLAIVTQSDLEFEWTDV